MLYFIVFLGGMIGAASRFFVTLIIPSSIALFFVNGMGSFLMGSLQYYFKQQPNQRWQLFLTTGILGAFTTFSAFTGQWLLLMEESIFLSILYAISMTLFCILLAFLGYVVMKKRVKQ